MRPHTCDYSQRIHVVIAFRIEVIDITFRIPIIVNNHSKAMPYNRRNIYITPICPKKETRDKRQDPSLKHNQNCVAMICMVSVETRNN